MRRAYCPYPVTSQSVGLRRHVHGLAPDAWDLVRPECGPPGIGGASAAETAAVRDVRIVTPRSECPATVRRFPPGRRAPAAETLPGKALTRPLAPSGRRSERLFPANPAGPPAPAPRWLAPAPGAPRRTSSKPLGINPLPPASCGPRGAGEGLSEGSGGESGGESPRRPLRSQHSATIAPSAGGASGAQLRQGQPGDAAA